MFRAGVFAVALCLFVPGESLKLSREGVWSQPDLSAVSNILKGVLHTHMSAANRKFAENVAKDVQLDISAVINGTNMSKSLKREKVASAIKEIEGLQHQLEKVPNVTALKLEIEEKDKEMASKQAELEMDMKEIKVMKLKKELIEKKLQLQKLMESKMQSESKSGLKADAKAEDDMVAKIAAAAKDMVSKHEQNQTKQATNATHAANATHAINGTKAPKAANTSSVASKIAATIVKAAVAPVAAADSLGGILSDLRKRSEKLTSAISNMDSEEKRRMANLEALTKAKIPVQKGDVLAKGQNMLKGLDKEEHRKYEKARVLKKAQLAEIDTAIVSINKGDVFALQKDLKKMKEEAKALDAKTGSFLY